VIGSLMWTRTKSREPNTSGYAELGYVGTHGFDLQHDFLQFYNQIVSDSFPYAPFVSEYHIENKFKPL
jgi:hypothetical protein